MKISGSDHVYLDATDINRKELLEQFPNIYGKCKGMGIDISNDLIPVRPAQHYTCGGVCVDREGQTSIKRLFACGEVTCSGLHGANRLASNSLLEGIVYSHSAFKASEKESARHSFQEDFPEWDDSAVHHVEEWILISHNFREVQNLMSNYVGIVRSDLRLKRAERRIKLIYQETEEFYQKTKISTELCELRNIITCAHLTVKCAMARKESRGLHYTLDYPEKLKNACDTILSTGFIEGTETSWVTGFFRSFSVFFASLLA